MVCMMLVDSEDTTHHLVIGLNQDDVMRLKHGGLLNLCRECPTVPLNHPPVSLCYEHTDTVLAAKMREFAEHAGMTVMMTTAALAPFLQ